MVVGRMCPVLCLVWEARSSGLSYKYGFFGTTKRVTEEEVSHSDFREGKIYGGRLLVVGALGRPFGFGAGFPPFPYFPFLCAVFVMFSAFASLHSKLISVFRFAPIVLSLPTRQM